MFDMKLHLQIYSLKQQIDVHFQITGIDSLYTLLVSNYLKSINVQFIHILLM